MHPDDFDERDRVLRQHLQRMQLENDGLRTQIDTLMRQVQDLLSELGTRPTRAEHTKLQGEVARTRSELEARPRREERWALCAEVDRWSEAARVSAHELQASELRTQSLSGELAMVRCALSESARRDAASELEYAVEGAQALSSITAATRVELKLREELRTCEERLRCSRQEVYETRADMRSLEASSEAWRIVTESLTASAQISSAATPREVSSPLRRGAAEVASSPRGTDWSSAAASPHPPEQEQVGNGSAPPAPPLRRAAAEVTPLPGGMTSLSPTPPPAAKQWFGRECTSPMSPPPARMSGNAEYSGSPARCRSPTAFAVRQRGSVEVTVAAPARPECTIAQRASHESPGRRPCAWTAPPAELDAVASLPTVHFSRSPLGDARALSPGAMLSPVGAMRGPASFDVRQTLGTPAAVMQSPRLAPSAAAPAMQGLLVYPGAAARGSPHQSSGGQEAWSRQEGQARAGVSHQQQGVAYSPRCAGSVALPARRSHIPGPSPRYSPRATIASTKRCESPIGAGLAVHGQSHGSVDGVQPLVTPRRASDVMPPSPIRCHFSGAVLPVGRHSIGQPSRGR